MSKTISDEEVILDMLDMILKQAWYTQYLASKIGGKCDYATEHIADMARCIEEQITEVENVLVDKQEA